MCIFYLSNLFDMVYWFRSKSAPSVRSHAHMSNTTNSVTARIVRRQVSGDSYVAGSSGSGSNTHTNNINNNDHNNNNEEPIVRTISLSAEETIGDCESESAADTSMVLEK